MALWTNTSSYSAGHFDTVRSVDTEVQPGRAYHVGRQCVSGSRLVGWMDRQILNERRRGRLGPKDWIYSVLHPNEYMYSTRDSGPTRIIF